MQLHNTYASMSLVDACCQHATGVSRAQLGCKATVQLSGALALLSHLLVLVLVLAVLFLLLVLPLTACTAQDKHLIIHRALSTACAFVKYQATRARAM
jgi:hypothetical protein